ncbi:MULTISPECIES: SDR family NAD(P)-dependent oxidoreductase [unclassified Carboxylicivirga]|uniref:SDR family NAD(P)-dependent oxidoreductase n=1 Tax=Carboxylicivirga TaxID=1628153 RepID=UPI003D334F8E
MKRVALITGASSGIGKELACVHARHGGDMIVVARRVDKLVELKNRLETEYGICVKVIEKDLSDMAAVRSLYDEVQQENIVVDYLINNAGFGGLGAFDGRDASFHLQMIQLNIAALTLLTRLFLPQFKQRRSGRILNVSSTVSRMPGPYQAVYFASKAYVTSFSNALHEELRGSGVTVTNLMPGATESEFGARSGMDKTPVFKRTAKAQRVAEAGYIAMMKGKINHTAGLTFIQQILMKLLPFLPIKIILRQVRKMQEV